MVIENVLLGATNDNAQYNYAGRYAPIREIQGKLHVAIYYWNTGTLAFELATVPAGGGGGGGDASAANQVTEIAALQSIEDGVATHRMKVLAADDLVQSIAWLDAGTANERPDYITYSSAGVGGATHTKTITWALTSGVYRPTAITWT